LRPSKRLYVLDTNVLTHDPRALVRFQEHDVFIPLEVLEELDSVKRGASDLARNVREVSRLLDQVVSDADPERIAAGLALPTAESAGAGRLFLEFRPPAQPAQTPFGSASPDNRILASALAQAEARRDREVVLVTRDINLRIKARSLGLEAEDYATDRVIDDLALLPGGTAEMPSDTLAEARERGRFSVHAGDSVDWHPRLGVYHAQDPDLDCQVLALEDDRAQLERVVDYRRSGRHRVWGVEARNREQNFALNLLMDPEVDLVTLLGVAGTGKTLLALAAGLAQTLDEQRYKEIIVTRATIPVGEDIGYLPGTEEEKMTPWMGALMDNLEVLVSPDGGAGSWGRAATNDLVSNRIKLRSLSFMRGRTFLNRFVIIDEAQNLTRNQMKTLVTRAGPGTKVACVGNIGQIDTPYVTETTSGLTYLVERFKHWPHAGHVTLARGERSRLADFASGAL
jgi:PhoH-like ATPase